MKRSEMLQSIRTKLLGTPIDHDHFEDQILNTVEELGMIPPSIPTGVSGWDVGKGMPSYINEWTPENE